MSLNKFGEYAHPYLSYFTRKSAGKLVGKVASVVAPPEIVGAKTPTNVEVSVNLYGFDETYVEFTYNGYSGTITVCTSSAPHSVITINGGAFLDTKTILGKKIKKGDILCLYKRALEMPQLKIHVLPDPTVKSGMVKWPEDFTFQHGIPKKKFLFLLESGTITASSVTPSVMKHNGKTIKSLTGLKLKSKDIISFEKTTCPHFEAAFVIKTQ